MEIGVECASRVPRVLADPRPVCHLRAFGDSSVELELRLWIADPMSGINNVRSAEPLRVSMTADAASVSASASPAEPEPEPEAVPAGVRQPLR